MPERKTFRVPCAECGQKFFYRREPADPNAEGMAEKVVTCQFCQKQIIVEIPAKYVNQETLIRSRKLEAE